MCVLLLIFVHFRKWCAQGKNQKKYLRERERMIYYSTVRDTISERMNMFKQRRWAFYFGFTQKKETRRATNKRHARTHTHGELIVATTLGICITNPRAGERSMGVFFKSLVVNAYGIVESVSLSWCRQVQCWQNSNSSKSSCSLCGTR